MTKEKYKRPIFHIFSEQLVENHSIVIYKYICNMIFSYIIIKVQFICLNKRSLPRYSKDNADER